jgi:hypothetical protein
LARHAPVVAAASVNRDTESWKRAVADSDLLHSKIASQSRAKAGWAKLPVLLAYQLLSRACFLALAHYLRNLRPQHVFAVAGATSVECEVVCDDEFSATEDKEVFKSFWDDKHVPAEALWRLGFSVRHPRINLTTEQDERLLLLADIAAGLCHSAAIPDPGRIVMPLNSSASQKLLKPLEVGGQLAVDLHEFTTTYDEVFGEAMQIARDA